MDAQQRATYKTPLVKFLARGRLVRANASYGDFGDIIIFALDRNAGHSPQHRDLADVSERVGERALKQFFGGDLQRLFRRQVIIKFLQEGEEALAFFFPRQRSGIVPFAAAFGHGEAPVHQVADVRQNFRRRARRLGSTIFGKVGPSAADGFRSAIGDGSEGMTQEGAGVGHRSSQFSVLRKTFSAITENRELGTENWSYNFLRHRAPAERTPAISFSRSGRANSRSRKLSISAANPPA